MKIYELESMFGIKRPIMGMVHLQPLPGSPNYDGSMEKVLDHAIHDAAALVENGVSALIIENLGDNPYYPITTEPETIASMTRAALEIKKKYPDIPIGINVLRNSWKSALAIAKATDAEFIRLNVLTDTMATDQGIIQGEAHLVMRYRNNIGANNVKVFADIYAKHGGPLVRRDLQTVTREMVSRGMADAIIVSGEESSQPVNIEDIQLIKEAAGDTPVFLGSGIGLNTVEYVRHADGSIFGYGTKPSGDMNDPVDAEVVKEFMEKVRNFD